MTLDTKIKTMIAVGAIALATAVLPEQSYAQFAPTRLLEETRWDTCSVEHYTPIYDSLVKKYGTFLGKAAFRGFSRTELENVEADIKYLMSDPTFSKYPLQVSAAIIAASNMSNAAGNISLVNNVDDYLHQRDGAKYNSSTAVATIIDVLDIYRECQDTKFDANDIINAYINNDYIADAGPLNYKDLIIAYALKNVKDEKDMKDVSDFGKMLMKDKKYSRDLAGTVMVAYARGEWKKESYVKLTDTLIANKYSEKLVIGMMYAYGLGPKYSRYNDSEWMVFNDQDNLERIVSLLKGKYDEDAITILIECCSGTSEEVQYRKL